MDNYKKKLKRRQSLFGVLALFGSLIGIYDSFVLDRSQNDDIILCFLIGLCSGIGLLAVLQIFRYRSILNDEAKLKAEYNCENDERMKEIKRRAGMPMLIITSALMILSAIIIGHFNITVFITLVAAAICQITIGGIVKLYYMKKL